MLGPVCRIPVFRILELKKNDKTINVGIKQSIKCASDMSPFPPVPREAIVVGAGLCDGEGERAYTGYAPHHTKRFGKCF